MENNFEKNVRDNLDGLRITPPETAWENIERKLDKPKRRLPVLWWTVAASILAVAVLFYFQSGKKNHHQTVLNEQRQTVTDEHRPAAGSAESSASEKIVAKEKDVATVSKPKLPPKRSGNADKTQSVLQSSSNLLFTKEVAIQEGRLNTTILSPEETVESPQSISKDPVDAEEKVIEELSLTDPVAEEPTVIDVTNTHPAKAENKNKNKWRFGVQASSGISFFTDEILSSGNEFSSPVYNSPGFPSLPSNRPPDATPPRYKQGFSYAISFNATKDLSANWQTTIGLGYRQNNVIHETSIFQQYQILMPEGRYRNALHFLEFSATAGLKFDVFKTEPIWEVGLNVAHLLSSDVLQYDDGKYFKDPSYLNKMQLGVETSFLIKFAETRGGKFFAAPFYQYQLSPVAKKSGLHEKRLNTAGLKIRFIFSDKPQSND